MEVVLVLFQVKINLKKFSKFVNYFHFNIIKIKIKDDVYVEVGESVCEIQSITETEIQCNLGQRSAGSYPIQVKVSPKGYANKDQVFNFNLVIDSVSNTQSSVYGGMNLTIIGRGFSSTTTTVSICSKSCKILNANLNQIVCVVPQSDSLTSDLTSCQIIVSENSKTITYSSNLNYVLSITPIVSSITPNRGGTGGGTLITINGSKFPTSSDQARVFIDNSECDIESITSTEIKCRTGIYTKSTTQASVQVFVKDVGFAQNTNIFYNYMDLWSSKWTWGGEEPPREGELAVIGPSQTIYFDAQETPILKGLIIQGGSLIFDDNQDVHLRAEYIIISDGGKLQIGTEQTPFQHRAQVTMYGSVRSIELPIFGAKVLALRNGTIDMHGKPVGVTWTQLDSTALENSAQIVLKEPVDWEINSEIVIASTGNKYAVGENELRRIQSISSDKRTLTLDKPLKFTHLGETRTVGQSGQQTYNVDIRAEVGLLTHNVQFRGSSDSSWTSLKSAKACPDTFDPSEFATMTCFLGRYGDEIGTDEYGATIMLHPAINAAPNTVKLRLSNVELNHIGQGFRLGRYPIHFHMLGDASESYVKECAIHESFNRALNVHATNYVTIEKNVIYNILGGAYFMEDGVEIGNTFKNNLAVFVRTSSSLLNEDVTPAAFWVTNPNNTYIGN